MPPGERPRELPLALAVLREELTAIDAQFAAAAAAADGGEQEARARDLQRSIDRYLRLESEVLYPVLARRQIDHARSAASHKELARTLPRLLEETTGNDASGALSGLRAQLRLHRQALEEDTFPRAAEALGDELPGLALELQEVRDRMKGAFGV